MVHRNQTEMLKMLKAHKVSYKRFKFDYVRFGKHRQDVYKRFNRKGPIPVYPLDEDQDKIELVEKA